MRSIHLVCRGGDGFGSGHLYRTSWLAAALAELRSPPPMLRVCCPATPEAQAFWAAQPASVSWLDQPSLDEVAAGGDDLVCVDWLDSDPDQAARLSRRCRTIVLLDDYGPAQSCAGLVVNALLSPLHNSDEVAAGRRVVSGPDWIQLPPEAVRLRKVASSLQQALVTDLSSPLDAVGQPVRMVLVSFGGLAAARPVQLALEALEEAGYAGKVLVMPAPEQRMAGGLDVDWHPAGPEFHSLLAAADLAICAGGLTLYEAAYLGVPALCLPLVGHQAQTAAKLAAAGCCDNAGIIEGLTVGQLTFLVQRLLHAPHVRGAFSAAGMRLLDGHGLTRTAEAIQRLFDA